MKYLGKKSISYFLKLILNLFWGLGLITFSIVIISYGFSIINNTSLLNIIGTIGMFIVISAVLFIIYQLRKVLDTLIDEKPFSLINVRRFRYIGYSILLIGVLVFINDLYFKGLLATLTIYDDGGPGIYTNIDVYIPFVLGIFSLILSEIFRIAYKIYEDNKLTI